MYSSDANQQDIKIWYNHVTSRSQVPKVIKTVKITLTMICFSGDKNVCTEGTALDETINSSRYTEVIENAFTKFGKENKRKRLAMCDVILQHNNAKPHVSSATSTFLNKKYIKLLKKAPYSPDSINVIDG